MTDVDDAIRRALSSADAKTFDALGREPNVLVQAFQAFSGRNRAMGFLGWFGGFALFAAGCFFAWRMIGAADVRETVLWAVAVILAGIAVSMIKLWFFLEMQKNNIFRELKRLELQVASLMTRNPS